MSNYGTPPPPPPSDAPMGYNAPPPPAGGMAPGPVESFAGWGSRVGAFLIDQIVMLPGSILMWIGRPTTATDATTGAATVTGPTALYWVGLLVALAIAAWNRWYKGGATGQTIGKGVLGIKLVSAADGQPIGAAKAFLRDLCHIVDGLPCYIGYLWPLWDQKKQTFADKIMGTYVVTAPK